jgi:glutathione S-transferase
MHPLSSYCHKALIAFYENDIPFTAKIVGSPESVAELKAMWPVGKFPVLRDEKNDRMIPEATIIIEYLDQHYPGKTRFIPKDPDRARQMRMRDRFFDNYLHTPMQKPAFDKQRPEGKRDAFGVAEARVNYKIALDMLEQEIGGKTWIMGEEFTLADCAAAPPLFYGNMFMVPFRDSHKNVAAYLDRLIARPSYARCLKEAEPFFQYLPKLEG